MFVHGARTSDGRDESPATRSQTPENDVPGCTPGELDSAVTDDHHGLDVD
jgi:hypothetical protein